MNKQSDTEQEEGVYLLTRDEERELIMSLGRTRGDSGFTKEDCQIMLDWANESKVNWYLMMMAIDGRLQIDVRDGDVHFCSTEHSP